MAYGAHFTPEQERRWRALDELESRITELWGYVNAATYRFLTLVAEFDREKAYERHGLANTAQWLNWQCGIGRAAAREKVRVARALEHLPEIADAFAKGEFSYSKVRAMTRVASPANESVLVNVGRNGTAAHVEKLVRKYRWTQRRDEAALAQRQYEQRTASYFFDIEDQFILTARLPREIGAVVHRALEVAWDAVRDSKDDVSAETSLQIPGNVRAADALRLMAECFLEHHGEATGAGSSGDRVQVVVHIDQAILAEQQAAKEAAEPHRCELEEGPTLALDTARRLACDATLVGLVEGDGGEPLDVGRKTRSIPPALARALRARDGGCRYPGCDRTRFCDGHHIEHWADGGATKLDNLITLCGFHHRLVHEGGYDVRRTDDGLFIFTRPDGRRVEDNGACFRGNVLPPVQSTYRGFEDSLRDYLRKHDPGLAITPQTSRCGWHGESMDYSQAIEAMQVLERVAPA